MGGGGKKTTKKPANPCAKNNGGCNKARKCMNQKGKAVCGNCPKGWVNLGAKNCKKGTAPKFSWGGNGKANCGKNKPVANEAACKSAAKTLKKAYGGTGSYAAWPKSCFLYNNKLYFNKHRLEKRSSKGLSAEPAAHPTAKFPLSTPPNIPPGISSGFITVEGSGRALKPTRAPMATRSGLRATRTTGPSCSTRWARASTSTLRSLTSLLT